MTLDYRMLGPLEVWRDDHLLGLGGLKPRTLLGIVLAHRGNVVSADQLIDALWGATPPPSASGLVQTYVSKLRKVLDDSQGSPRSEHALRTVEPGYRLVVADEQVDVHRFELLVAAGRSALCEGRPDVAAEQLRLALDLWRGPALADLAHLDPLRLEALRLDELRLAAIEERIDADIGLGRHAELIAELGHRVALHPFRERLWGQLMLCHYRDGRQADALRCFHDLQRRMREESGLLPSTDLAALERRILAHDPSLDWVPARPVDDPRTRVMARRTSRRRAGTLPFVGRRRELAALRAWWDDPTESRLMVVRGDAGVGKTRVMSTFTDAVEANGAVVLEGRAVDGGGSPYEPILGALRQLVDVASDEELDGLGAAGRAALARLVPDLVERRPDAQFLPATRPARSWILDSLAASFSMVRAPVLVALDDLQWASRSSLHLLGRVVRRDGRVRIVATCREPSSSRATQLQTLLADLCREEVPVSTIALEGLSRHDVASLLAARGTGDLSPAGRELATELHRLTAGNAFFLRETLRHLEDIGVMSPSTGEWTLGRSLGDVGVPAGIRQVVDQRLRQLDPRSLDLLRTAAVIGRDFDADIVMGATGVDDEVGLDCLDEAEAAGIVHGDHHRADRYAFTHDQVREVLLADSTQHRRARRALRAAETLEALRSGTLDRHAAELARLFAAAADVGGTDGALRWTERAGDLATASFAHEDAIRHYELALGLLDRHDPGAADRRAALLTRLGASYRATGATDRARSACLRAATEARRCGDPELLAHAAIALLGPLGPGEVDDQVVALLEEAAAALERDPNGPTRKALLAEVLARLTGYDENVRPEAARRRSADALGWAHAAGDRRSIALALLYWTQVQHLGRAELVAAVDEAVERCDALGDLELALLARSNGMAAALAWADRAAFDRRLDEYGEIAGRLRSPAHLVAHAIDRAGAEALAGRYGPAREGLRAAHVEARGLDDPNLVAGIAAGLQPVDRELGLLDEQRVRRAAAASPRLPTYQAALANVLAESGSAEESAALVTALLDDGRALTHGSLRRMNLAMLSEAAHHAELRGAAAVLYDELCQEADVCACLTLGSATFFGSVHRCLGLLAATLRRHVEAVGHHQTALEVHQSMRAVGWAARSRYDLARSLLALRPDDGRASELLDQAGATARELGMTRLTGELDELVLAEVDGNRTRRTGITRPDRFEGGGAHQVPGHLRQSP